MRLSNLSNTVPTHDGALNDVQQIERHVGLELGALIVADSLGILLLLVHLLRFHAFHAMAV